MSPGERSYYDAITAPNIKAQLQGASFSDVRRSETDAYGNIVSARAEYGNDGTNQKVTFFDAFFGYSRTEQNQIVTHEGMHLIFRFGDSDLARGGGVYREDSNASSDFQKELQKHCK